ncbi:MAG: hypothetical protein C4519_21980 [Desulfobacteraceae bacterium]|nr:MAG: hypothetical protein C4519_21980 [Desulfobacteraceae bacterium]
MNLPNLEEIGFGPGSHRKALRLLAMLYCDPLRVHAACKRLGRAKRLQVTAVTLLHAWPYLLLLIIPGRWLLFHCPGLPATQPITLLLYVQYLVYGLSVGLSVGLVFCLVFGLGGGLVFCLVFCLGGGIVFGLGVGIGLSFFYVYGLGFGFGFSSVFIRFYYLPAHWFFLWTGRLGGFRNYHPVFWDHCCFYPFPRLERLLVDYAEMNREDGEAEIERLIADYFPYQRRAGLYAKTALIARDAGRVQDLKKLDGILASLPEGEKGFLTQTRAVREKAAAICRQQLHADSLDRPFFREQAVIGLRAEINAFIAQVSGFHEPLASEFRRAANAWFGIADGQLAELSKERRREPTPQIFRAGDPVRRDAEAFVVRTPIIATLENEIMAGAGCPGILLYGRRRVGKSTVINNLDGFLPGAVMSVVVSMQAPAAFTSENTLAGLLAREIGARYPAAQRIGPEPTDLITLYQFFSSCNTKLEADHRRLLICLDEFEELDEGVGKGRFTEGLPKTLRESVQSHRCITWLFAGSHRFIDLPHVPWSSYLVSLRTIEVPPFTEAETRLLLTDPLQHARRPEAREGVGMFGASFWEAGVVERIHGYTAGWPHLVQLVAATIVDLCNTLGIDHCGLDVLEKALDKSVTSGDTVMAELMFYRSEEYPSAWPYLTGFRTQELQSPPADDGLRMLLKHSLLIRETADGKWTLRVPMMADWLRNRT